MVFWRTGLTTTPPVLLYCLCFGVFEFAGMDGEAQAALGFVYFVNGRTNNTK